MGNKVYFIVIMLLFVGSNVLFSQQKQKELNIPVQKNSEIVQPGTNPVSLNGADYKIINSTPSYLEIEYYPYFEEPGKVKYNGEEFSVVNLAKGVDKGLKSAGEPDVKTRYFPVMFPGRNNNTVTIVDYDVREVKDFNLAPIPSYTYQNPGSWVFENIKTVYAKSSPVYSKNAFFPGKIAEIESPGSVRDFLIGSLKITPFQYNPVSRVLKQYTRIRVKISFGSSPVMLTRKQTPAERELMNGIAINYNTGKNWMNPQLLNQNNLKVISNSVLSTGDWYKVEIKDDGHGNSDDIYKITKSFLESAGINLSGVDPRTIKMYGNGGEMLPQEINEPRPQDLVQIAIYIAGENDGTFDPQDYILFYGKSVNNWKYDNNLQLYTHYVDIYTTSNYYWICINTPGNGKRMITDQSPNVQNPIIPSSFTEKLFNEPEINNLINEGNVWLSERKSNGQSFVWNNTLTGLQNNSEILYRIKPASRMFCGYTNYSLKKITRT